MHENDISYLIRGSIFDVYNYFGPGLLESVYQKALRESLLRKGCNVLTEQPIEVEYFGHSLGLGFRADIVVNGKVIVEVKSVECLRDVHYKQLLTYLRLTDIRLGLLVNFNSDKIESNITRVVNNL